MQPQTSSSSFCPPSQATQSEVLPASAPPTTPYLHIADASMRADATRTPLASSPLENSDRSTGWERGLHDPLHPAPYGSDDYHNPAVHSDYYPPHHTLAGTVASPSSRTEKRLYHQLYRREEEEEEEGEELGENAENVGAKKRRHLSASTQSESSRITHNANLRIAHAGTTRHPNKNSTQRHSKKQPAFEPFIYAASGTAPPTTTLSNLTGIQTSSPEPAHSRSAPPCDRNLHSAAMPTATFVLPPSPFSLSPLEFHKQHFNKPNRVADDRAHDCWVWFFPTNFQDFPSRSLRPNISEIPLLHARPPQAIAPRVACRICFEHNHWTSYQNGNSGGIVSNLRRHLHNHHEQEYNGYLHTMASEREKREGKHRTDVPEFTLEGFYKYLMEFVVANDESIDVVDSPEFINLMVYVGQGVGLTEDSMPGDKKLLEIILLAYKNEYDDLISDMKACLILLFRVYTLTYSLHTECLWAYFIYFRFMDRSQPAVFHGGKHTGECLANVMFDILREMEIVDKIGQITLDNASSCYTMMEHLEVLIRECFPHVINLAVHAVLDSLSPAGKDNFQASLSALDEHIMSLDLEPTSDVHKEWYAYRNAVAGDVLARSRHLVSAFRVSGGRRHGLRRTILEGNSTRSWPQTSLEVFDMQVPNNLLMGGELPVVQLLRDCDTRWSSVYMMITRILTLWPALQVYAASASTSTATSLDNVLLSPHERKVLRDLYYILRLPHRTQELLSSENTPTASYTLVVYEILIHGWQNLKTSLPHLRVSIDAGINKLREYIQYARSTQVYGLSMIVNPIMKFDWIKTHWTVEEKKQARDSIADAMLWFRNQEVSQHIASQLSSNIQASAAESIQNGLDALLALGSNPVGLLPSSNSAQTSADMGELESEAARRTYVRRELQRYEEDGLEKDVDMLTFWMEHEKIYPLLFRVAMDTLPTQASAVPCEQVFSSSKETVISRRSRLIPATVEVLQVLKYRLRHERLNFSDKLACEDDYTIEGPVTDHTVEELVKANRLPELTELLRNSIYPASPEFNRYASTLLPLHPQ
ncbi:hypothetical protein EVG20_g9907 [Dentipellis fragilis]|uniref:HAT C-terminal dimerisation domain-containing protein n=1 Tax=Dentipellis fragilis TaxID=205917 RepID=A0A4Y9XVY0_9AGAM|nr:hypothetical protein EVG20_g9907 [Dentipellis fragilis]